MGAISAGHQPLYPGATVWLTPRTASAPAVCYGHPKAKVVRVATPYLVVTVKDREHRVHEDNVRRSDPNAARGVARSPVRVRPVPPGGEEVPLW